MSKKAAAKKSEKQAKEAAKAAPTADEAKAAEAAAAEEKAKAEAEAKAAAEKKAEAEKQAKEAAKTVQVIVGPNGAAGRIVVGKTTYDGVTPRPMAKGDFERLKATYDLQEVKKK